MAFMKRRSLLIIWLSRANLKQLMACLFGLTIAISMIAGYLYFVEFARNDFCKDIFEEIDLDQLEFSSFTSSDYSSSYLEIQSFMTHLNNSIRYYKLDNILEFVPYTPHSYLDADVSFQNETIDRLFRAFYGLDNAILDECVPGSRMPGNLTEVLVHAPANTTLAINSSVNLTISYFSDNNISTHDLILTVAGILTTETMAAGSPFNDYFNNDTHCFFLPLDQFVGLISAVNQQLVTPDRPLIITHLISVNIEYNNIDPLRLDETVYQVIDLMESLERFTEGVEMNALWYSFELKDKITEINNVSYLVMLFTVPVLLMTTVLVFFSLSISNDKRQETITLLKTRGIPGWLILLVLLLETAIMSLIASVIAVFAGLPLAMVAGSSSGYLSFTSEIPDIRVMMSIPVSQMIFVIGSVFTFSVNLIAIVKLARMRVFTLEDDEEELFVRKEKGKMKVLSSQFDMVFLITGLAGMLLYDLLMDTLTGVPEEANLMLVFAPLIYLLLIFSPVLFILGAIMGYNRFILLIIHVLHVIFWRRNWGLLATSAVNLKASDKLTVKTTLLLIVSLSFLIILIITPVTLLNYQEDSVYYKNGAEMTVSMGYLPQDGIQEAVGALNNITGLKATSVIRYSGQASNSKQIMMLGIQQGFTEVAHWKSYYADKPLSSIVRTLLDSQENNSVIINTKMVKRDNLNLDINNSIELEQDVSAFLIPVIGTGHFPGLMTDKSTEVDWIIGNYSFIENLTVDLQGYRTKMIWGKILPGYNQSEVAYQARQAFGELGYDYPLEFVFEGIEKIEGTRYANYPWVIVNSYTLNAIIVILASVLIYNFAKINREKQLVGLNRALGMDYRQILTVVTGESFLLLLISGLPAITLVMVTAQGLVTMFGSNIFLGPPLMIEYNLPVLVILSGIIFAVMVISGLLISIKATRTNISDIMKAE